jgi:hypothetical protein
MPAQRAEPIWTSIAGEVAFAAPGDTSTTRHLVQVCGLNRCFWPAAAALASNVRTQNAQTGSARGGPSLCRRLEVAAGVCLGTVPNFADLVEPGRTMPGP